ncbi:M67 family metallopeptidase [Oceanobacillus senegalensis]|uniref:M67 family metallopeptidase n=1 Tax=Oceanobacillus senegalensis TaxID=1936063 RepID=UPI000A312A85|nr:M67 family metallopeptidase [Oceanobacillus senegalensis]
MSNNEMVIPQIIYDQMVEYGRENFPYEACGLLSGRENHVYSLWPLKNSWKSVNRFFVKKDTVERVIRQIEQREEQVLAIYHTHPFTAPVPSSYDIRNHPDNKVAMVITSYKTCPPKTKWYQIQGSNYTERYFCLKTL